MAADGETIGLALASVRASLLDSGAVSDGEEARAESEILLAHVLSTDLLSINSAGLITSMTQPLPPEAGERLAGLLKRRLQREPLRYITGSCPFYGRDFAVDRRVLIPRQETELVVERALRWAGRHGAVRIADIGTGSGVLAITLALELDGAEVHAVDISPDALDVAAQMATALAIAHEAGIAHRDIKPENVMLRRDGSASPRTSDFTRAISQIRCGDRSTSLSPTCLTYWRGGWGRWNRSWPPKYWQSLVWRWMAGRMGWI